MARHVTAWSELKPWYSLTPGAFVISGLALPFPCLTYGVRLRDPYCDMGYIPSDLPPLLEWVAGVEKKKFNP